MHFDHFFKISGRIRVAWHPNGEEEVVKEKNVGLADRSLMPGDVVRRLIEGKDTQRGKNMMTSTVGLLCQAIINLRDFIESYSKRNSVL